MPAISSIRLRIHRGFLVAVGGFLIATAVLKGHQLAYDGIPAVGLSLLKSIPFLYVLPVTAEFFLGVWLVSGVYRKVARLVTILCFFGFMNVALWLALSGQRSCGCMGQVAVNPWVMFFVDVGIFSALAISRLDGPERTVLTHRLRFSGFLLVALALGVPGFITMVAYRCESPFTHELRHDRLLHNARIAVDLQKPTAHDLVALVDQQAGIRLTVDDSVKEQFDVCQPDWDKINHETHRGWVLLEAIPKCLSVPSRWLKTKEGYVLIYDNPVKRAKPYWLASLTLGALGFCWLGWNIGQRRSTARKSADIADLPVSKVSRTL